ncbi:MAG: L-seryl-tRNA(Sec) selenium transferase [Vicinamibacterales bacterium]|nr:L-seryl-tRNA(Sec) selenium transferase [Vicinamibacterales bacterium]
MPDFRVIPSIDQIRQRPAVQALERAYGAGSTLEALRDGAVTVRRTLTDGGPGAPDSPEAAARAIEAAATSVLARDMRGSLVPVINATGVIVHTNLGRAPLAPAALAHLVAVAQGYSNLEYDLERGARGSRTVHAERLLTLATGAEAAVVVNNNAAATMLMLAGLASGREVLISRGELVEIGGGFRVPDVMAQSGATLREVGTTNRTRVSDYTVAAGPKTALILRVHPSNFRVEGFTERPSLPALVEAGRAVGVPVAEDLGSGNLQDGWAFEPPVRASLEAGVDLVCFSGDKILGGPQAGILAGRRALVDRLRAHPLMRALRVDKLTLAALEATLLEHLAGRAADTVPVARMIAMPVAAIEARARALAATLAAAGWSVEVLEGGSAVGGGSAPGLELPTRLVAVSRAGLSADALEGRLRGGRPPIIARIVDDRVVLDLRTVAPGEDDTIVNALR